MPELEMFFEYPESKYNDGIMLEEYHDRISLVAAYKSNGQGTAGKKWCYPQKDRGPAEKAIPWKIELGHDRDTAIQMLQDILRFLNPDDPGDGSPF